MQKALTKSNVLLLTFASMSLMLLFNSCRKIDKNSEANNINVTDHFFKVPEESPGIVKRAADYLKKKNQSLQFAEKIAEQEGFPFWKYADIKTEKNVVMARGGDSSSDTLVFIPLVPSGAAFVRSIMVFRVSGDEIKHAIYQGSHYRELGYTFTGNRPTANSIALKTMEFNVKIWNRNGFSIRDTNLAMYARKPKLNKLLSYRLNLPEAGSSANRAEGEEEGCMEGAWFDEETDEQITDWESYGPPCEEEDPFWFDNPHGHDPGSGGDNPGGGGGGGGNSGGGDNPPEEDADLGWTYAGPQGSQHFQTADVSPEDQSKINYWKNNNIDTVGLDSCIKQIISKLITAINPSPLGKMLTKLDRAVGAPNTIDKFKINFRIANLNGEHGKTVIPIYDETTFEFECDILLDSATVQDGTDIFIAQVLVHEIVHAYMDYVWLKINQGGNVNQVQAFDDQIFSIYVDTLIARDSSSQDIKQLYGETYHHNYMANFVIDYMADVIEKFDNSRLSATNPRYYWYLAWTGLMRKSVKSWYYHWPNWTASVPSAPIWPPANPAPVEDSTRGLRYALTLSRIDSIFHIVQPNEADGLPGALGNKRITGKCY